MGILTSKQDYLSRYNQISKLKKHLLELSIKINNFTVFYNLYQNLINTKINEMKKIVVKIKQEVNKMENDISTCSDESKNMYIREISNQIKKLSENVDSFPSLIELMNGSWKQNVDEMKEELEIIKKSLKELNFNV